MWYFNLLNNKSSIVDFYIFAGQSNCGRSQAINIPTQYVQYKGLQPNCFIYNVNTSGIFQQLNVGVNTKLYNANNDDEFGAEASFMRNIKTYNGIDQYIFKYGYGNTDLYIQWSGSLYTSFKTALQNAIIAAEAEGVKLNLKYFIWMQGENDATNITWANAYLTKLTTFFQTFTTDYSEFVTTYSLPTLNYQKIIGRINGINDPSEVYRTIVRQAQYDYCADLNNNAILIDTDAYPLQDIVHYSALGNIQFGLDIYNSII